MKRTEIILMVLQLPLDFVMLLLAGFTAYQLRFSSWAVALRPVIFDLSLAEFMSITTWVALGWIIIFTFTGLYSTDPNRKLMSDLNRVALACSAGLAAIAVYVLFSQELFDSRFLVALGWVFAVLYVGLGRILIRALKGLLYRLGVGLRRVLVIGGEQIAEIIVDVLKLRPELGYQVVGACEKFSDLTAQQLRNLQLDEVIYTNPRAREDEALSTLDYCNEHHVVFKYSADLFATHSANITVHPLAGVPIVELKRTPLDGWGRVAKRLFDIIMSLLAVIIFSPLLLLSTFIILIETGWPVIYKNERVGLRGRQFFTLKFRSMYQKDSTGPQFGDAGQKAEVRELTLIEKQSIKDGPVYKIANDPRVTPFGHFIRRWSIDELPQFFNVLGGSMSIVGPRPHQSREVAKYEKHHKKIFTLKPGITGLAQISGRSDLSFAEEARLDILYIEKWSLFLDLIIFLKTPFVLFKKRKAL